MLSIVFFYALMAGVFTVGKEVVLYAYPFFLTALRLPTAGLVFILFARFWQKHTFKMTQPIVFLLLAYGVAIVSMDSGRFFALQTLPAANTALITSLAPFAAAFLSYLFLGEHMTARKLIILAVGFIGMLPLFLTRLDATLGAMNQNDLMFAYGSAFFSMLGFVLSGLFIKILNTRYKFPMFMSIGWGMVFGGIMGFMCSFLFDPWNPLPFINASKAWPIIIYLFFTHNLLAYPMYGYLLERYPLTLIAFAQLLTPLFTAILRLIIYNEPISYPFMISFGILSGALYLFYKEEKKEGLIT